MSRGLTSSSCMIDCEAPAESRGRMLYGAYISFFSWTSLAAAIICPVKSLQISYSTKLQNGIKNDKRSSKATSPTTQNGNIKMVSNLRGNFFNFFCLIDSAKDFKKNSCCLIGFAKLSSVRKYEHNVSIHTKHDKKMGGHCEIIF